MLQEIHFAKVRKYSKNTKKKLYQIFVSKNTKMKQLGPRSGPKYKKKGGDWAAKLPKNVKKNGPRSRPKYKKIGKKYEKLGREAAPQNR